MFSKVEERLSMLNRYEIYLKDPNENYSVWGHKYTAWCLQQISAGEKISKLEAIAMQTIQDKLRGNKD